MRTPVAALALILLTLPATGQVFTQASDPMSPPGYSGFTAAPMPSFIPREVSPADRAGTPGDSGGPVNGAPFAGIPYNAFLHNGGQISPSMQDTSAAWQVIPDLSK
jgi:hypothetical protein